MEHSLSLSHWDYVLMLLYTLVIIGIGIHFSRKKSTSTENLLAGRSMHWLPVGISMFMALFSTYSLVMTPGEVYLYGISLWVLHLIQPFIAIISFALFYRFFFKMKSFTTFEYLEYRYDKVFRLVLAFISGYGGILYIAMVVLATALIFEAAAGWPAWITILVVGLVGTTYAVMGGLKAVIWSDVFQFIVLGVGFVAIIYALCTGIDGGAVRGVTYAFEHGRGADRFTEADFYKLSPYVRLSFWLLLWSVITGGLSAATNQTTMQLLVSTKSYKSALRSQWVSAMLVIPVSLILMFMGLSIFTYFSQHPDPTVKGQTALFSFIAHKLPTPFPGLVLAAVLAAAMSTVVSGINSTATLYLKELHQKYFNPDIDEQRQFIISWRAVLIFGLFCTSMALLLKYSSSMLSETFVEMTTIFAIGGAIGFPAYIFAVLSRKASSRFVWRLFGIMTGLQSGTTIWYAVSRRTTTTWKEGDALGWGGPIPIWPFLLMCAMSIVIWVLYKLAIAKWPKWKDQLLAIPMLPFGMTVSMLIWYIVSHASIIDKPRDLSFQWGHLPLVISYIVICAYTHFFGPEQPKEKYEGLVFTERNDDYKQLKKG